MVNTISNIVSKALKCVIDSQNLTIKQAAEIAGVRPEHLSKYVNRKASISFEKGWQICNKLGDSAQFTRVFRYQVDYTLKSESCKWFY